MGVRTLLEPAGARRSYATGMVRTVIVGVVVNVRVLDYWASLVFGMVRTVIVGVVRSATEKRM